MLLWSILFVGIVVALVLVALNALLGWHDWARGVSIPLNELGRQVEWAMKDGYNNARMRVGLAERETAYIDFLKKGGVGERVFFLMIVHERACAAGQFEQIQHLLTETGISHSTDSQGNERSLVVDCDQDLRLAADVARSILTKVWHASPDAILRRRCKGLFATPLDSTKERGWNEG